MVSNADCYADPPVLTLWSVLGSTHRLFTFTGGSGGSVKTALAASRTAASDLLVTGGDTRTTTSRTENTAHDHHRTRNAGEHTPRYHTIGIGAGSVQPLVGGPVQERHHREAGPVRRSPGQRLAHPLLYPGVRMQTGWMKDLVSLVDPRHELTFLQLPGHLRAALCADQLPVRLATPDRVRALPGLGHRAARRGRTSAPGWRRSRSPTTGSRSPSTACRRLSRSTWCSASAPVRSGRSTCAVCPPSGPSSPTSSASGCPALDKAAPIAVIGGGQTGLECVLRLLGIRVHRHPLAGPEPVVPQDRRLADGQRAATGRRTSSSCRA